MPTHNRYFRISQPVRAWHLVMHMEGNEWIGASRCLWPVYQAITLQPGDEIHELFGGTFGVSQDGKVYESIKVVSPPKDMSVMLKGTGASVEKSVADVAQGHVEEIAPPDIHCPPSYRGPSRPVLSLEDGLKKTVRSSDDALCVSRILLANHERELLG